MKQVKFLFTMLVMIAALGFTACGDDDDEGDDNGGSSSSLVGTWRSVSATVTEDGETVNMTFNDENYVELTITSTTITSKTFSNGVEIKEDTDSYAYTVSGNKILSEGDEFAIYDLKGDTLTITIVDEGDKVVYKRK